MNPRCALAPILLLGACTPPAPPPRPNILVLSIDTLRADHLGCYGYPLPTSPNLDRLAARSALFEHAESASSWTLPSMTSLMTGLSTSAHNCDHLGSRLDPSYRTFAEVLRDAGYDTGIVASHLFLTTSYGLQQGFTHVDTSIVQDELDITSQDVAQRGIDWIRAKSARAAELAARPRDDPEDDSAAPWLLWLHFFDPHAPYLAHPGISERFGLERDVERYDGEIAYTDLHLGRLLDELEQSPLAANTIVVVVADHGEEFGEHGNFGHGYALYEECVRVPLIVHVPGVAPRRVEEVVPTVDLAPTLLDLARVALPHEIEGQTIAPLLWGESVPEQEALSEVRWQARQDIKALRNGRWKWIEQRVGEEQARMLFDIGADPTEECERLEKEVPRAIASSERLLARLRDARRIASGYHQLGESQLSPFEQARLGNLGYTGDEEHGGGGGGVPGKKPDAQETPKK